MSRLRRRIWKWSAALVAALLILLAIGVGLFRVAVPLVPGFKADAETMAEQAIGWPVHIGTMDLRWAWLGPELVLGDVQLLAPDTRRPLITAARIDIAFGPADLFQEGIPRPSHLRLHEPTFALERMPDGRLVLSGYALPERQGAQLDWRELLELALQHGRMTLVDGEFHYRDMQRGIEDWTLLLPHLSLASDGQNHEFEGSLVPPGALGEQLAFRFVAGGSPAQPEQWRWNGELGARQLQLAWWYRQLNWAGEGELRGSLNLSAQLEGRGWEQVAGSGQLAVSELGFASREPAMVPPGESAVAALGDVAMHWRLERSSERLAVDMQDIAFVHDGERHEDVSISLQTGGDAYPVQLAVARLPLRELTAFAPLLPQAADEEADIASVLRRVEPRGMLRELVLSFDPEAEPVLFRVQAGFDDLGFNAWNKVPGVDGISGQLNGTQDAGTMTIESDDVRIDTGDLFRELLPARRLVGQFEWEARDSGWRVSGENILVENPEASAQAAFTLDLPSDGSPVIDMTAKAFNVDFAARSRWLPVGVMSDALVKWLDEGVVDGHAPEATLKLQGPLANFPFRDESGVFDIRFRAEDTVVEYAPGWPRVENLAADVHFRNAGLDIKVDHARVLNDIVVSDATAGFADFRAGLLSIRASAASDMGSAWRFLAASPLGGTLQGLLGNLEPRGPFNATLSLDIPVHDIDALELGIDAGFDNVDVGIEALPWPVKSLSGRLQITENSVSAKELAGTFTGAPVTLRIVSEDDVRAGGFAPVHVHARGRSPVDAFDAYVPQAWLQRLDGAFDWQSEVVVAGGEMPLVVNVSSDLDGVSSRLPAPLHAVRPVAATVMLADDEHIDAALGFDSLGAAQLRFVDAPDGWRFDRGQVSFGAEEPPALPQTNGLTVAGSVPWLAGDAWLSLDDETTGGGEDVRLLQRFDLRAARVTFRNMALSDQGIAGRRSGAGWELILDGPVTGAVAVPSLRETKQPWSVMLEQLHLPQPGETTDAADNVDLDPRELPPLVVDIRDFQVGAIRLGHVAGELRRTPIGYTTQNLRARAPSFELALDGRWEFVSGEHYTSIVGELTTRDLSETLDAIGYRGGVDADDGSIKANIAWHDSPFAPDRALLEGNVSFSFRDGSLSEVKPGAGRLLGLLSIAALPRRLLLDFSDLFGKGLHFDVLTGDFLITGGNAYTTNVQLRGPSVSALLVGRTGLVAQDYDQLAIIDPDVSASLPVAGYLAAGPSVGAALLLLSQLLKAPLSDIAQAKYRITGSWEDPVIERIGQDNERRQANPAN